MNKKSDIAGIIIAFVLGAAFFCFGAVRMVINTVKYSSYEKIQAEVVDEVSMQFYTKHGHKTKYAPIFEYEVNGHVYQSLDDKFTDKHRSNGTEITAYYNTEAPDKACTNKTDWIGIFFIIFGGMIIITGFLSLMSRKLKHKA